MKMIGVYSYTVLLTYISLLSAGTGIVVSLSGNGHPYIGGLFLLICGLCDAFDGKVARSKKNRTELEKNFGIQIDSLCDIVAFGVLPACIGAALIKVADTDPSLKPMPQVAKVVIFAVLILYILAAMIRLAYFNVTEEERQKTEGGVRKYYVGLPVTSASIVFPTMLMLRYIFRTDVTVVYFVAAVFTGLAFISKLKIRKPGLKGILAWILVGVVEFAVITVFYFTESKI